MAKGMIGKIARKDVLKLQPYTCARDLYKEADIFLDANESAYGKGLNRYPDSDQIALRKAIASYVGGKISWKNVLAGNGSDELIDLCMRVFAEKGDNVLCATPDYSMYRVFAGINGIEVREVQLDGNFKANAKEFVKQSDARTKMVFLSSPNSPTGEQQKIDEIEKLAKKMNAIIFVDEAYFEFSGKTVLSLLSKCPNIVICRTLSKAWGLAGARVGYIIASSQIIDLVRKIKPSYNVSSLSSDAAIRALTKGRRKMMKRVLEMRNEREKLASALSKLGFAVYPSCTNFILCKCPQGTNATALQQALAARGIIVRDFSSKPRLGNCLRITVGAPKENARLMNEIAMMAGAQFDSVIFDMDEVLVNTTQSYLKAIEITANQMLGADRVGKEDVRRIKLCRWFNDDIDCAYRLVALAKAGKLKSAARAKIVSEQERKSKDYKEAEKIFQTAYLGKKYSGLIKNETPLVSRKTLGKLRAAGLKMGIATGRPRKEAEFAIRKNGWEGIFSAVVCVDDCARKKPCPDPLLLAKKKLGALNPVYVGDNEADKQAAASAGIPFASVGRAKGKWNLAKTDDILKLVVK